MCQGRELEEGVRERVGKFGKREREREAGNRQGNWECLRERAR
jgi:hypothetical protein